MLLSQLHVLLNQEYILRKCESLFIALIVKLDGHHLLLDYWVVPLTTRRRDRVHDVLGAGRVVRLPGLVLVIVNLVPVVGLLLRQLDLCRGATCHIKL